MPDESSSGDITRLIHASRNGNSAASQELVTLVYDELRRMAIARMKGERQLTYQPTDLVHEVFLNIFRQGHILPRIEDQKHFFLTVSVAMTHLLINKALARKAAKRGGGPIPSASQDELAALEYPHQLDGYDLTDLKDALKALKRLNPTYELAVRLHYLSGCDFSEIGAMLGVDRTTANKYARKGLVGLRQFLDDWTDRS